MAFDYNPDDLKVSKINPAWLKMERLNEINSLINNSKLNPSAFNIDYSEYNYLLWLRGINNLLQEVEPKFEDTEKERIYKLKAAIETNLNNFPVMEVKNELGRQKTLWNELLWRIYKKWFEQYENEVKTLADKHGLDTPQQSESSLF
jgi:hypothetical protein